MIPNTYHNRNLLQQEKKIVDPPPKIIPKADTGETAHYFTQADAHALLEFLPTKMGPQVRLIDNRTMYPEQVSHLPLSLTPAAT